MNPKNLPYNPRIRLTSNLTVGDGFDRACNTLPNTPLQTDALMLTRQSTFERRAQKRGYAEGAINDGIYNGCQPTSVNNLSQSRCLDEL